MGHGRLREFGCADYEVSMISSISQGVWNGL